MTFPKHLTGLLIATFAFIVPSAALAYGNYTYSESTVPVYYPNQYNPAYQYSQRYYPGYPYGNYSYPTTYYNTYTVPQPNYVQPVQYDENGYPVYDYGHTDNTYCYQQGKYGYYDADGHLHYYNENGCRYPTYSDYQHSYQYYEEPYARVTSADDALPSYYEQYTTPPQKRVRKGYRRAETVKYYPPATTVPLLDNKLHPANITVKIGTMVTWVNDGDGSYALEGDNFDFQTTQLGEGQEASYSFSEAGTYHYHDRLHPWIKGTVTVTR